MVSNIQPAGFAPIAPLQTQAPRTPTAAATTATARDSVALSGDADLTNVHDALDGARSVTDLALAAGREGANLLSQMRDLARAAVTADDPTRADLNTQFQSLLKQYGDTIGNAVDGGARLLAGESLSIALDAGSAPVTVPGYDLRLKTDPGAEDALRLSTTSNLSDESAARAAARDADASLARVDTALSRLSGASQRLSAHENFLSSLDGALQGGVREPADAEGARLLALQVRQTLLGANAAIANSAPQALLSLFRE